MAIQETQTSDKKGKKHSRVAVVLLIIGLYLVFDLVVKFIDGLTEARSQSLWLVELLIAVLFIWLGRKS